MYEIRGVLQVFLRYTKSATLCCSRTYVMQSLYCSWLRILIRTKHDTLVSGSFSFSSKKCKNKHSTTYWCTFCENVMSSILVGARYPTGGGTWEKSRYLQHYITTKKEKKKRGKERWVESDCPFQCSDNNESTRDPNNGSQLTSDS